MLSYETVLPSKAGILELRDTTVLVLNGTCTDTVCSSFPQHGPREPVSVSGCSLGTGSFADRPDGPGHGSRSRWRTWLVG